MVDAFTAIFFIANTIFIMSARKRVSLNRGSVFRSVARPLN